MAATLILEFERRDKIVLEEGDIWEDDYLSIRFNDNLKSDDSILASIRLIPKKETPLGILRLMIPFQYNSQQSIFCNGFQSWSESRVYEQDEYIPNLRRIARPFMGYYGDYHFHFINRQKGFLHSWTYTYIENPDQSYHFIASLDDTNGFTCFEHCLHEDKLEIIKDWKGSVFKEEQVLQIWASKSNHLASLHRDWFEAMSIPKPKAKPASGWTSWYHHYTNISERIILDNANHFAKAHIPIQFFQIDDGYQKRIGDWLDIKPSFPNGLSAVADDIKASGYAPGLWIAPFVAERKSTLVKEHPEWLLRYPNGKAVKAGYNPLWSGWFYALDIYHPEFRSYLENVFDTMLLQWGFAILKLDFLYAACILPRAGKNRGQIMHEAMSWLREISKGKLLLGCGVPLMSAFGQVDYCRIGADIHLKWEHALLKFLRHRERVSTILSLRSTLSRWALSGLAFWNDPDVFLLRDTNIHLTNTQKQTIQLINQYCGHLLFTSDDLSHYTKQQWKQYRSIFPQAAEPPQKVVRLQKDVYRIDTADNKQLIVNLTARQIVIDQSVVDAYSVKVIHQGNNKLLSP
jgi:alpha-galactosidase